MSALRSTSLLRAFIAALFIYCFDIVAMRRPRRRRLKTDIGRTRVRYRATAVTFVWFRADLPEQRGYLDATASGSCADQAVLRSARRVLCLAPTGG